jgi:hypothetical protein
MTSRSKVMAELIPSYETPASENFYEIMPIKIVLCYTENK